MTAPFKRPAFERALELPSEFSKFEICSSIDRQLEQVGRFGCDASGMANFRRLWPLVIL